MHACMLRAAASLCASFLLLVAPAQAEVYTYRDAAGNRVFTDQPHPNAKRVDLPPSNRISTPTPVRAEPVSKKPAKSQWVPYQMLRILIPLPDAAVRETNGELIVTLTSDPALQEGHQYRLLLDGEPVGDAGRSPVIAVRNIDRGTHKLAAEILDSEGAILERTPAQPVHIQRISLSQKRRVHPCKTADYGVRPECPLADKPADEDDDS